MARERNDVAAATVLPRLDDILRDVCADGTRMAGPGETVYWEASREAALTLEPSFVPVDHAIVGLVDDVQIDEANLPVRSVVVGIVDDLG